MHVRPDYDLGIAATCLQRDVVQVTTLSMDTNFTIDDAERLIDASRSTLSARALSLVVLASGAVLVFALTWNTPREEPGRWLAPAAAWVVLGVMAGIVWGAMRRRRNHADVLADAIEAGEQNDWPRVGRLMRGFLSRPVRSLPSRAQGLLLLATAADRDQRYDVSECLFESVLQDYGDEPRLAHQAMLGLAASKLRSEQLTDAIRLLGRLRKVRLVGAFQAGVELLGLFQEVMMGHFDDAVASVGVRRPLFRQHLSTRAGFAYGLFAAAFDAMGKRDDAAQMWHDATMLIRPDVLLKRYELLRPLSQRYAECEWPI